MHGAFLFFLARLAVNARAFALTHAEDARDSAAMEGADGIVHVFCSPSQQQANYTFLTFPVVTLFASVPTALLQERLAARGVLASNDVETLRLSLFTEEGGGGGRHFYQTDLLVYHRSAQGALQLESTAVPSVAFVAIGTSSPYIRGSQSSVTASWLYERTHADFIENYTIDVHWQDRIHLREQPPSSWRFYLIQATQAAYVRINEHQAAYPNLLPLLSHVHYAQAGTLRASLAELGAAAHLSPEAQQALLEGPLFNSRADAMEAHQLRPYVNHYIFRQGTKPPAGDLRPRGPQSIFGREAYENPLVQAVRMTRDVYDMDDPERAGFVDPTRYARTLELSIASLLGFGNVAAVDSGERRVGILLKATTTAGEEYELAPFFMALQPLSYPTSTRATAFAYYTAPFVQVGHLGEHEENLIVGEEYAAYVSGKRQPPDEFALVPRSLVTQLRLRIEALHDGSSARQLLLGELEAALKRNGTRHDVADAAPKLTESDYRFLSASLDMEEKEGEEEEEEERIFSPDDIFLPSQLPPPPSLQESPPVSDFFIQESLSPPWSPPLAMATLPSPASTSNHSFQNFLFASSPSSSSGFGLFSSPSRPLPTFFPRSPSHASDAFGIHDIPVLPMLGDDEGEGGNLYSDESFNFESGVPATTENISSATAAAAAAPAAAQAFIPTQSQELLIPPHEVTAIDTLLQVARISETAVWYVRYDRHQQGVAQILVAANLDALRGVDDRLFFVVNVREPSYEARVPAARRLGYAHYLVAEIAFNSAAGLISTRSDDTQVALRIGTDPATAIAVDIFSLATHEAALSKLQPMPHQVVFAGQLALRQGDHIADIVVLELRERLPREASASLKLRLGLGYALANKVTLAQRGASTEEDKDTVPALLILYHLSRLATDIYAEALERHVVERSRHWLHSLWMTPALARTTRIPFNSFEILTARVYNNVFASSATLFLPGSALDTSTAAVVDDMRPLYLRSDALDTWWPLRVSPQTAASCPVVLGSPFETFATSASDVYGNDLVDRLLTVLTALSTARQIARKPNVPLNLRQNAAQTAWWRALPVASGESDDALPEMRWNLLVRGVTDRVPAPSEHHLLVDSPALTRVGDYRMREARLAACSASDQIVYPPMARVCIRSNRASSGPLCATESRRVANERLVLFQDAVARERRTRHLVDAAPGIANSYYYFTVVAARALNTAVDYYYDNQTEREIHHAVNTLRDALASALARRSGEIDEATRILKSGLFILFLDLYSGAAHNALGLAPHVYSDVLHSASAIEVEFFKYVRHEEPLEPLPAHRVLYRTPEDTIVGEEGGMTAAAAETPALPILPLLFV